MLIGVSALLTLLITEGLGLPVQPVAIVVYLLLALPLLWMDALKLLDLWARPHERSGNEFTH